VRPEANLVTSYFGEKARQVDCSPSPREEYHVVPCFTPVLWAMTGTTASALTPSGLPNPKRAISLVVLAAVVASGLVRPWTIPVVRHDKQGDGFMFKIGGRDLFPFAQIQYW
jgi:hypothetical protein